VIANDICSKRLLSFPKKRALKNLTLTSQNILDSEFCLGEIYDLIICKNTLHHLPPETHLALIKKFVSAGKTTLIIDIENPMTYSLSSFLWNFYYRKFLKDDGLNFISIEDFEHILKEIKKSFSRSRILKGSLRTIKGNYLFAYIDNKHKGGDKHSRFLS